MDQLSKQSLGSCGEFEVLSRLSLQGFEACISNMTKNNFKGVDIFCQNPETGEVVGIQVKTSTKKIFPVGLTIGDIRRGDWQTKIKGPWVFVHVSGTAINPDFRFFILSHHEMIDMIGVTHDWYINKWERKKELSDNGVVCVSMDWLLKKDEKAKPNVHPECIIPLTESAENQWQKLWNNGVKPYIGKVIHRMTVPDMEITVDKEGKSIKIFSPEEIQEVKELIQNELGFKAQDVVLRTVKNSTAQYLIFDIDDRHYVVRFADHTYAIPAGENCILLSNRYEYRVNGLNFIIEPSLYRFTSEDIVNSIKGTEKWYKHFNSKENIAKIKRFVNEYVNKEEMLDIYCNSCEKSDWNGMFEDFMVYPSTFGMELASYYIDENNIDENNLTVDEYDCLFTALSSIMERELETI